MKWILVCILGVLIACSFVAWAMIPDLSADGRTVLVWMTGDNPARRGTIELFEKLNPDIRVVIDPGNAGVEKVIVQCKGGVGPDIFNVYTWWHLLDYTRTGVLLPLDEYADQYGFGPGKTFPQMLEEISVRKFNPRTEQYERTLHTVPGNVNANVIFFHKSMFDEIGESYPSGEWTWDECLETAKKLVRRDHRGRIVRYGIGTFEMMDATEMIWQFGGELFDPTLTYCVIDSPEAIEAITFLHRMIIEEEVMPSRETRNSMGTAGGWGGSLPHLFANRQVAMLRIGRWGLVTVRKYPQLEGDIGAVHLPHKREKTGIVRGFTVGINPKSPNREAGLRFLEFLATEEFSWQVVESADALPPSPKVAHDQQFLRDPTHPEEDFNHLFIEAIDRGRNMMFPPFIQGMRIQKIMDRYLAYMSEGNMPPEKVCRRMTNEINKEIRINLSRYASMRAEYKCRTGRDFDPEDFPPHEARP